MKSPRFLNAITLAALLSSGWIWRSQSSPAPTLRVTFLDVGQGDAAVVETPGGGTMVVDAGRSFEDGDAGRQIVLPYLRSRGIDRVHALALTHADDDHSGGAKTLLQRIRVDRVLIPSGAQAEPTLAPIQQLANQRRIPVVEVGAGQTLDFNDGCLAEVLNPLTPQRAESEKDNDRSLVLRIRRGATSLLLTGDVEESAEARMTRQIPDLAADVFKAPHHGSKTSTSARFLDRVRPQLAIISAGKRNNFGHPHPTVLHRLQSRGIRTLRTDLHGAITIESNGQTLRITTARPLQ